MEIFFLKFQFLFLFVLYLFAFYKLFKKGFGFSLGLIFSILYFIFIPLLVFSFTDEIEISRVDFYATLIKDIRIKENISSSFFLIGYLYSFLLYVFFSDFLLSKRWMYNLIIRDYFIYKWKRFFLLWLIFLFLLFYLSGVLDGGHWYKSRDSFRVESGLIAVILDYVTISFKLIFISVLISLFYFKKINKYLFLLLVLIFSILDVLFTGNRIFLFILFASISIIVIDKYKWKTLFFGFSVIPLGYFMSIYQRIRGSLFLKGIPDRSEAYDLIKDTIINHPPQVKDFLLGISESVNFNVLHMIFETVSFKNILYGETYLKVFTYFVPRSIWADKPISITQVTGNLFAPKVEHLSLVATMFGEMHLNFYFLGLIIMPILLFFTSRFFVILFSEGKFRGVILFLLGILMFRMSFSDILLYGVFTSAMYHFFLYMNNIKRSVFNSSTVNNYQK